MANAAKVENWSSLLEVHSLKVSNQCLSGLPDALGELKNLEELVLTNTRLRRIPDSVGELTKLKKLCLT